MPHGGADIANLRVNIQDTDKATFVHQGHKHTFDFTPPGFTFAIRKKIYELESLAEQHVLEWIEQFEQLG